uniref:Uncharacterized protein n=1 Tax=viral metagenome TaxID=1070528 RepID=A0A6C0KMH1_9ZZZZ
MEDPSVQIRKLYGEHLGINELRQEIIRLRGLIDTMKKEQGQNNSEIQEQPKILDTFFGENTDASTNYMHVIM